MAQKPAKPRASSRRAAASAASTDDGVHRVLNVVPSKGVDDDWLIANATEAGVLRAAPPIPPTRDLRESWWKVADQGSTGACVGFATADSVLRWHFVKANLLKPTEPLSVRFIWMASKETDEFSTHPTTFIEEDGTSLKAALDIARKYGAVPDEVLPFASGALYPHSTKTFYALAAQRKIASYFNLKNDLGAWRKWLATQGPILTRLDVDRTWNEATATAGKLEEYVPPAEQAGHAVALVGYAATHFIVRNSWGEGWGDKGFAYASYSYAQAAFSEAYGVTV